MKKISTLLFCSLLTTYVISQSSYRDLEIKDNVNYFRKVTVSLGIDTILSYIDFNGNQKTKRIFKTAGTGVLFYFKYDNNIITCVVTAKHVLKDSANNWVPNSINVRFSNKDSLSIESHFGTKINLYGDKNLPVWFEHPNPEVDLAAFILVSEEPMEIQASIPYSFIAEDNEVFEGKEIFVLGYPGAVGVDLLNRAVLRKGIISWVPNDIKSTGNKYLIDCNIFPGNSGGPVFIPTTMASTILTDTVFEKPKFCGIVTQRRFSVNTIKYNNGQIVKDNAGLPVLSLESIGIGVVISASKVRELLNLMEIDFTKFMQENKLEIKNGRMFNKH